MAVTLGEDGWRFVKFQSEFDCNADEIVSVKLDVSIVICRVTDALSYTEFVFLCNIFYYISS